MKKTNHLILRDFFIILCLILLLILFISMLSRVLFGERATKDTVQITVVIEDVPYEMLEDVKTGERVLDRTRRTVLGNIVELSTTPHTYERAEGGESVLVNKNGYCDALFRIEIDQENRRNHDTGVFYIGAGISLSTQNYAGDGKICAVTRGVEK